MTLPFDSPPTLDERVSLTGMDIGFILSGEFGPRTCPCGYCVRLATKLQAMLQQTPTEPARER